MEKITTRQFRNNFGEYFARLKAGEVFELHEYTISCVATEDKNTVATTKTIATSKPMDLPKLKKIFKCVSCKKECEDLMFYNDKQYCKECWMRISGIGNIRK